MRVAAAIACSLGLVLSCRAAPELATPNILLITLDTTRADHLSCYGYDRATSPNLDALALESVVYTHVRSTSSWTLPAHASLFTGKLPPSHGAGLDPEGPLEIAKGFEGPMARDVALQRFRARGLAPDERVLAELLRERGYQTAGVVAGPWLKRVFGLARGFDAWDDAGIKSFDGRSAQQVSNRALVWLHEARVEPFFLFLNYFDPHLPYSPPAPYSRTFFKIEPRDLKRVDEAAWRAALYDGEILYMDHHLGRLFDGLRELGLYDRTLIVVTGDHGEMLGERGMTGHSNYLYEELLRIPMLVKHPLGEVRPRRDGLPLQLHDVFAMILDRVGIPLPENVQGEPPPRLSQPRFAQVKPEFDKLALGSRRAFYDGDLKFIWNSAGSHELFDLEADPEERRNLVQAESAHAERLGRELERFVAALPEPADATPGEIDAETAEALRGLGYLGEEPDDIPAGR